MTYTIGDRRISLDTEELDDKDQQLIISHRRLFKYCLNNATFKLLINVKKIVHLYTDIMTIYSTLLKKIPHYEDITIMTNLNRMNLNQLESQFNQLLGTSINERDINQHIVKNQWQFKSYESIIKPIAINLIEFTMIYFNKVLKNINCIKLFFEQFDNLRKLLIPFLLTQTTSIKHLLTKQLYLFNLSTISDNLSSITITTIDSSILKQLKKIEKITSGIERESIILETAFKAFDPSLQQYTNILLGKAILKREIEFRHCQIIKRRDICYQAAEHVVSIPLTEEDQSTNSSMKLLTKYLTYLVMVMVVLVVVVIYRLLKIIIS